MEIFVRPLFSTYLIYIVLLLLFCKGSSPDNTSLTREINNDDVAVLSDVHITSDRLPDVITTSNIKAIPEKPITAVTVADGPVLSRSRRFFDLPFKFPFGQGHGNFGYGNRGYGDFGHGAYRGYGYGDRDYGGYGRHFGGYGRRRGGNSWDSREDDR